MYRVATCLAMLAALRGDATAEEPPAPASEGEVPLGGYAEMLSKVQIHGFASQGAFFTTDNEYIGHSSRGSLELFESAINITSELGDRLRMGFQLFAGNVGTLSDGTPRVDWAYLDYRWRSWIGLRGGIIKIPHGLYNEFTDVDPARVPILMPQAIYPIRNRDVLISHTGFSLYGSHELGRAGTIEYQAFLGSLTIPRSALELQGATLDEVDTKYVAGAQVLWSPLEGLRVGASFVRASIDFNLTLSAENTALLIGAGLVPADFDGRITIAQRPAAFYVGSVEYTRGPWLFAAEYSRNHKRQRSTIPQVLPTFEEDGERFYGMANYQLTPELSASGYYSVSHADVHHRTGRDPKFARRFFAFQRDAATTLRYDVNEHWLWKLEAHVIDGTTDLSLALNPDPVRYWALFLLKTTVTF